LIYKGDIIDGFHRYEVAKLFGWETIKTEELQLEFKNDDEIIEWIQNHQKARRNLSKEERDELILEKHEEKQTETGERRGGDRSKAPHGAFAEDSEPQVFYNSHGTAMLWSEMRELEVVERGNYIDPDFNKWGKKYNIKPEDKVLWVTSNLLTALTYAVDAAERDVVLNMTEQEMKDYMTNHEIDPPVEFTSDDGFIIPESGGGDE